MGRGFRAGSCALDGVGDGEGCLDGDVVLYEEVCGGVGGAPDELADLEECQDALEVCGDFVAEGVEGVVGVLFCVLVVELTLGLGRCTYHHSMNPRIDKDKHPDRRTHIPNTSPHTQHSTSVMIRLKRLTPLALGQDDQSINDLVELAHVEEPAPKRQPFVPQSSHIRRVWIAAV